MSPPAAVPERPAFEALRARLSDALSSGADPRLLLRQALEQLTSAGIPHDLARDAAFIYIYIYNTYTYTYI